MTSERIRQLRKYVRLTEQGPKHVPVRREDLAQKALRIIENTRP